MPLICRAAGNRPSVFPDVSWDGTQTRGKSAMSDDADMRETARREYAPPELRVLTPEEVDDLVGGAQDLPEPMDRNMR
jgi:hypothetical protein